MRKFLNLLRSPKREQDLDRELRYHLDRRVEDLVRSGLGEADARRQAAVEFGGIAQVQEEVRETWIWQWLHHLARDARYAARTLARSPGFAATAVLSLALGIGANTAIFSVLQALVLRSLPVEEPHRLVLVTVPFVGNSGVGYGNSFSYPYYRGFRDQAGTLDGVLAFRTQPASLTADGAGERITSVLVSGNYFEVLGVSAGIGSTITSADDQTPHVGGARGPVAVISHGLWMRKFGGSVSAIGSRILLNGHPFTVVGVTPKGFSGTEVGESPDVYAPMMMQEVLMPMGNALAQPINNWLRIMGRLKRGIDVQQAEAEMTTLLRRFHAEYWRGVADAARERRLAEQRISLRPGNAGLSGLRGQYSKPLWVLMVVMALVLLIACANLANLLLSRAAARRREIALRLGLGAARSRLVSQLLTESLILALAGAASGLLLARWLRDTLLGYLPPQQTLSVPLDLNVLLFTAALAAGAALLFGLAPAMQSTRIDLAPALKGDEPVLRRHRALFRYGLVVFQMSLSFVLLLAAALFLRSLHNLLTIDPGFARENIIIATIGFPNPARMKGQYSRLLENVKALPAVASAALADSPPLGTKTGWEIFVPGFTPPSDAPRPSPSVGFISPGYFATMNTPLLLGRDFEMRDMGSPRKAIIVNETFARYFFAGRNPVGSMVGMRNGVYDHEIIGVVKDGKYTGLREEATRMLYVPQEPIIVSAAVLHLRTSTDASAVAPALRRMIRELDSTATVSDIHTVQQRIERTLGRERLVAAVTGLFGALALVLAAIGLYGVMAYGVSRRTREFGIRMAVGAGAGSIVRLVVHEAMWLVAAGIATGFGLSWLLGRWVRSLLFGIEPWDLPSAAIAMAVLAAVALLAAWIPARRASSADPTAALRSS